MLKYTVNSEEFGALNEMEQSFYSKDGDGYKFQIEGAVSESSYNEQKEKTNEFRGNNVDLMKKFGDVDLDEVRELQEQKRKLLDAEFINKKDFEGLKESATRAMKSDHDARYGSLEEKYNASISSGIQLQARYEIEGAASKAFGEHAIRPGLAESTMLLIKSTFSIDNGQVVAKSGDNILTGADGNLTISEFVGSLGEDYKIQSQGGKAQGNDGQPVIQNTTAKRDAYAKLMPNSA